MLYAKQEQMSNFDQACQNIYELKYSHTYIYTSKARKKIYKKSICNINLKNIFMILFFLLFFFFSPNIKHFLKYSLFRLCKYLITIFQTHVQYRLYMHMSIMLQHSITL